MDPKLIDELHEARALAYDGARPDAVAKVHARKQLTARERIAALVDPGSFVEYGVLAEPANPQQAAPADGLVGGVGTLEGSPVAVASYDYTVYGGTQTGLNHGKIDRLMDLAYDHRWPFVCFADGGGFRAHDLASRGMEARGLGGRYGTFAGMAHLSGWVPTVSVVSGKSFAGNASIAGFSDFVVATRGSSIGMSGPPLVEAAMGMRLTPEELGPVEMHERVGGVDLLVDDEPTAVQAARAYLSYFLGDRESGEPSPTAGTIRSIVPESRRRAYDVRKVIVAIADADSVFELRPNWARSVVTALVRLGGRSVGVVANQPMFLAGAIDSNACDKIARFVELCDAYDFPIVSLIDTPGFMVGPDSEATGMVRHHARPIMAFHHRTVPLYTVQLRKAYGLGPQGMGQGMRPDLALAWPTAESGAMGLEGAASIVRREEVQAAEDARTVRDDFATEMRALGAGLRAGRRYSVDDVIDPAETRDRIVALLRLARRPPRREQKKHYVDAW